MIGHEHRRFRTGAGDPSHLSAGADPAALRASRHRRPARPEPDLQRRGRQCDHRLRPAHPRDLFADPDRHGGTGGRRPLHRPADRLHQRQPDPALRRRGDHLAFRVLRLRDRRGRPLPAPHGPHHRLRPGAADHRRPRRLSRPGRSQSRHPAATGRRGARVDDALGPRYLDLVSGTGDPGVGDGRLVPVDAHRLLRAPAADGLRRADRLYGRGADQRRASGSARHRGHLRRARGSHLHLAHQFRRSDPGHHLHPDGGHRPRPGRHQPGRRPRQHHRLSPGRPQHLPHHLRAFDLQLRHGAKLRDRCGLWRDTGRLPPAHPGPATLAGRCAAHLAHRLLRRARRHRIQRGPPFQGRDHRTGQERRGEQPDGAGRW